MTAVNRHSAVHEAHRPHQITQLCVSASAQAILASLVLFSAVKAGHCTQPSGPIHPSGRKIRQAPLPTSSVNRRPLLPSSAAPAAHTLHYPASRRDERRLRTAHAPRTEHAAELASVHNKGGGRSGIGIAVAVDSLRRLATRSHNNTVAECSTRPGVWQSRVHACRARPFHDHEELHSIVPISPAKICMRYDQSQGQLEEGCQRLRSSVFTIAAFGL